MLFVAAYGAASSSAGQPKWKPIPVRHAAAGGGWFQAYGWASGRVWFGVGDAQDVIWSAKVQGGTLTSFVSTPSTDEQVGQSTLIGSSLVDGDAAAPLLASGKVGPAAPIPGNPAQTAHDQLSAPFGLTVRAGVTIGSRTIWAVAGTGVLAACCTDSGQASDLSSILVTGRQINPQFFVRIGVDAHGRLWLAWSEYAKPPLVTLHIAQLDPATLKALSSKNYSGPAVHGGGAGSQLGDDFTLACVDSCRLVFGMFRRPGIFSWGGDAAPTKVAPASGNTFLLAAGAAGDKLVLAFAKGSPDYGWQLSTSEASPTGAGFHVVATSAVPQAKPHPNEVWNAAELRGTLTPSGFVLLAGYPLSGRTLQSLEATVLHG